jgi:hypothetical protein
VRYAAEHHDDDQDHALDHVARFGLTFEEGQVGPDELEDDDGDDRADDAAAAAREADPAEDDGGDALERVRARHRRPDARVAGEREPPSAAKSPVSA